MVCHTSPSMNKKAPVKGAFLLVCNPSRWLFALGQHIGQGVILEYVVVVDGCRRVQGNQGIANVGQRLVQLLDGALQAVVGGDEGGKLRPKKGMGLPPALSSSQPSSGVRIRKP